MDDNDQGGPDDSPSPRDRLAPWIVALVVVLGWYAVQPPAPRGAEVGQQGPSAVAAATWIEAMASEPRPPGSAHNAETRRMLVETLHGFGWDVERQAGRRAGHDLENLVARWPPSPRPPEDALLLVAHHDSRSEAPGAGDDAAGVAAVLEVARLLPSVADPRVDVVLLISDGEEWGLLGARLFAEEHEALAGVRAVINVEGRGCAGPSTLFETGPQSGALVSLLADSTPHAFGDAIGPAVYAHMPNDTDFSVFRDRGLPGLNFAFFAGGSVYHRAEDTPRNLDLASVQHHAEVLWALTERVAREGWPASWGGDRRAVTVPLLGMFALDPQVLDVAALLAMIWAASVALRELLAGRARAVRAALAVPATALAVALSAAVFAGVVLATRELGVWLEVLIDDGLASVFGQPVETASASNRVPTELTSVAAFAFVAACAWPLGRLQERWGLRPMERALGGLALWIGLVILTQVGLPGATHLALCGLLASLGGLSLARSRSEGDGGGAEPRAWEGLALVGFGLLLLLPVQHLLVHVGSVDERQVLIFAAALGGLTGGLTAPLASRRLAWPALLFALMALGHAGLDLARAAALS